MHLSVRAIGENVEAEDHHHRDQSNRPQPVPGHLAKVKQRRCIVAQERERKQEADDVRRLGQCGDERQAAPDLLLVGRVNIARLA